jgi:hypothetical protein
VSATVGGPDIGVGGTEALLQELPVARPCQLHQRMGCVDDLIQPPSAEGRDVLLQIPP